MLELTGVASVLRGMSLLYWLVAVSALAVVIWKVKKWWGKALSAVVVLVAFGYVPAIEWIEATKRETYARDAWAYFKRKCQSASGERIYKTFADVKSVLIAKPLPSATEKDIVDQYWYGDPYSNATPTHDRDVSKADTFLRDLDFSGTRSRGFEFVEIQRMRADGPLVERLAPDPADRSRNLLARSSGKVSRFALGWEDISTPEDRKYWVAGSRLSVVDLADNSVVAERIGYLIESGFGSTAGQRRPWLAARGIGSSTNSCPPTDTWADRRFVLKVLKAMKEE